MEADWRQADFASRAYTSHFKRSRDLRAEGKDCHEATGTHLQRAVDVQVLPVSAGPYSGSSRRGLLRVSFADPPHADLPGHFHDPGLRPKASQDHSVSFHLERPCKHRPSLHFGASPCAIRSRLGWPEAAITHCCGAGGALGLSRIHLAKVMSGIFTLFRILIAPLKINTFLNHDVTCLACNLLHGSDVPR